jgi:glucosamine-6-phosphate deaminase
VEVIILDDAKAVADKGAQLVCELVEKKPGAVLGLATGSTPILLYQNLIQYHNQGRISFKDIQTFNLDEYYGISADSETSFRRFMDRHLFTHIDIPLASTHLPASDQGNPRLVGPAYEEQILSAGGIDLQILGIGRNGHIGFNEPGSSLASRTRIKTLTRSTLEDNRTHFSENEEVPEMAITMGIGTIMDSHRVLLLATGSHKARAVKLAVEGPISALNPASALQAHQYVTVLLDEEAAADLELQEYYRWVYEKSEDIKSRHGNFYEIDLPD